MIALSRDSTETIVRNCGSGSIGTMAIFDPLNLELGASAEQLQQVSARNDTFQVTVRSNG